MVIGSTQPVYEARCAVGPAGTIPTMHTSSHEMMGVFVDVHLEAHRGTPLEILDFGSQMIGVETKSYRTLFDDPAWSYTGVDIVEGPNVDRVLADPYRWDEIASESLDVFVSGQSFEHIEHFWVTIFETVRVLKPGGLAVIIVPSTGYEHRFPVDCWRFYPDGLAAMGRYAQCDVLDTFADWGNNFWSDAILVIRKPEWSESERQRFDRRAGLQRLMLSEDPITADRVVGAWQYQPQLGATPSVLAEAPAGRLTSRLTDRRDQRVAVEEAEAERERTEREHELHELRPSLASAQDHRRHLESELERVHAIAAEATRSAHELEARLQDTAERPPAAAAGDVYHQVRAKVADVVGEPGRALYRRLRGRG